MKPLYVKLLLILVVALINGCAVGPFEEVDEPDRPSGPGIFTGAAGEFSVTEFFSEEKKRLAEGGGYYILDLEGAPPMTQEEFKEFESFRAWLKAKEQGTPEYKEYESWRAFQQYRQLQSQKQDK